MYHPQRVCVSHRGYVSPTECAYQPQRVCVTHRGYVVTHRGYVSPTEDTCYPQRLCVTHRGYVSPTECAYQPQRVCNTHRGYVSHTEGTCHPQSVHISHRGYVTPTEGMYHPQRVCISHREYVLATEDKYPVGNAGFARWGHEPLALVQNLLFGKIFSENCMKMKEIGPSGVPHGSVRGITQRVCLTQKGYVSLLRWYQSMYAPQRVLSWVFITINLFIVRFGDGGFSSHPSIVGSVVECSPATRAARVRFPDDAKCFFEHFSNEWSID